MGNISTVDAVLDGQIESRHGGKHQNRGSGMDSKHRSSNGNSKLISIPAPAVKKPVAKKEVGAFESVWKWVAHHQIGLSINILTLLLLAHTCFPKIRPHTRKTLKLSYFNPETGKYGLGLDDAWMVSCWVVIITGVRASIMDYILMPLGIRCGVKSERDRTRFCEQSWLLVYVSFFWSLGMYIFYNSNYWLNLPELWTNFPDREIEGLVKWYSLVQYSFWIQQVMVLYIEDRRKDHNQMLAHHIVTIGLITSSYCYHLTRVANLILVTMDTVDLFFPTAKCLKYMGFTTICDIMFGLFMLVWVVTRHVIFMTIVYSLYAHSDTVNLPGCYIGKPGSIIGPFEPPDRFAHLLGPFIDTEGIICWTKEIKWVFISALLFLQVITLVWFGMIVRVAAKVLKGGQADDTRSDDEEEEEKEEEEVELLDEKVGVPFEEEVGVEELNLNGRLGGKKNGNGYRATGVSIPDRKQLLGRIGCDKGAEE